MVFRNISLDLRLGEHTAILGPNGAGKSALIKLLSREIYPVVKPGSRLRIFGRESVNLWDLRRRIGMVSPDLQARIPGTVPVSDVVLSGFFGSVGIGRSQQPTDTQRLRVGKLINGLGLEPLAARPFHQLSDGQRRRVLLARALVHDPELLVLDEPTNALDLQARHQFLAILRGLAQSGTTVLLVTHQIEVIIPEITRCVLLREGLVVCDGPADAVLREGPLSTLFDTPLQVCAAGGYRQAFPAATGLTL